MPWLVTKYLITAALIVLISEVARNNGKAGAFLTALPLVALLSLVWMHVEKQTPAMIASYAFYTFWYVIPTLPMFLLLPVLLPRLGFWFTLMTCIFVSMLCFGVLAVIVRRFGISLL